MFVARALRPRTFRSSLFSANFHSSSVWSKKVLQRFKLADIGEGITECEVIKWNIGSSSKIEAFDPLCEVQSDKASVEITSPFDGVVKELLVKEGEIAKVGEALCLIEVEEEVAQESEETAAAPPPHLEQEAEKVDLAEAPSPAESAAPIPKPSRRNPHPLDPSRPAEPSSPSALSDNVLSTPSVRHFARQKGLDLSTITGSGKGGRIERKDVEAALSGAAPSSTSTTPPASESINIGKDTVIELGRTRYGMWKAMTKSLEIPHFGYSTSLDLTSIFNLLPILNRNIPPHYLPASAPAPPPLPVNPSAVFPAPSPPSVSDSARFAKLTYLPILLKTLSRAMTEWPLFRSSITPDSTASGGKPTLTVRPHADIAIALSTPTGLYTPTLQSADTLSIYNIASRIRHLSHLGRLVPSGLTPAEMPKRGGTLTVSNIGAIGAGEGAMPVLVPGGGVAIVAIGRAVWVRDEERGGERRLKVSVSWAADHRVVEGAELAAFVECWRAWAEAPERLIGDSI